MAWLIAQPQISVIVGARYPEQVKDNVLAIEIKLSADELAKIDLIDRIVTDHLNDSSDMWDRQSTGTVLHLL